MYKRCATAICFILLSFSMVALAGEKEGSGWAVDAKAGTLGIGGDLSRSLVPRVLNLRVGASFFTYSLDFDEKGISYSGDLTLGAVPIAVDAFPFKNWFRVGGGLLINLNKVKVSGVPTAEGTINIGDNNYSVDDFGRLDAEMKFNRVAPYVGFGFNNPIKKNGHWGFFADIGLFFHGSPTLNLTTTQTVPAELQQDIDREMRQTNEDLKDYSIYPVVQVGVSYKF